jgi:hypothetical protein
MKERVFAEIKMVGAKKFEQIKASKEPIKEHFPQVQQQFLVTGYERGFYIAYQLSEDKKEIKDFTFCQVKPDRVYIADLFKELKAFWQLVQTQAPPELSERDVYEFFDPDVFKKAEKFKSLKSKIDKASEELEKLEKELKAMASAHSKVRIGDLEISKVVRQGAVKYKDIPQLAGVDLDKFRGPATTYQTIKMK